MLFLLVPRLLTNLGVLLGTLWAEEVVESAEVVAYRKTVGWFSGRYDCNRLLTLRGLQSDWTYKLCLDGFTGLPAHFPDQLNVRMRKSGFGQ